MLLRLAFIIILAPYILNAQHNRLVSNQAVLEWAETHLESPKDSLEVVKSLHKLRSLTGNPDSKDALLKTNKLLSRFYNNYFVSDSALYYANEAKTVVETMNNKAELASVYLQFEDIHKKKAEYDTSMEYNFKAIAIFEELNNQIGIARAYTRLCDLLYYENKHAEGAVYCEKAIAIQQTLDNMDDLALSYRFLADNQLALNAHEEALNSVNTAIDTLRNANKKELDIIPYYNTRGNVLKYMDRFEEALSNYKNSYDLLIKDGNVGRAIPLLGNIGHVYTMQKQFDKAIPYHLEAIELMKSTGDTKNLWENYMHISDCYKALGDFEKALEYNLLFSKEYSNFQQSIINRLESEIQVKYETNKKNQTISNQDAKIVQQRKSQTLYLVIAALLAISLLGMFLSAKNIRKKRLALQLANTELDAKNKQNEQLLKEIHLRVKNNLEMVKNLISLQSSQLDDQASKEAMLASQNRVHSMGIIHEKLYQGTNLESIDMKDYFINLSEGILDSFNAEDKVQIECAMDNLELDVDTAVPVGLIVNELLSNALKYDFPEDTKGHIKISMTRDNHQTLHLQVANNAIGKELEQQTKTSGFGSQLIQLLTRQLNGTMKKDLGEESQISFQFDLEAA